MAFSVCLKEAIPFYVLGKGSNSLFDDRGFDGAVIVNRIGGLQIKGEEIHAGGGLSFSLLGVKTAKQGLAGLEFACGIPGSVGGAVWMNAGANGSETGDVIASVDFLHQEGEFETLSKEEIDFSYRYSGFQKMKGMITGAKFLLKRDAKARKKQLAILSKRSRSQPYDSPSCGCVFRNPKEESAGALIEKCGLKGMREGGAEVSLLHGNFIINREGASAKQVEILAKKIAREVKKKTGVELEFELRFVSYKQ